MEKSPPTRLAWYGSARSKKRLLKQFERAVPLVRRNLLYISPTALDSALRFELPPRDPMGFLERHEFWTWDERQRIWCIRGWLRHEQIIMFVPTPRPDDPIEEWITLPDEASLSILERGLQGAAGRTQLLSLNQSVQLGVFREADQFVIRPMFSFATTLVKCSAGLAHVVPQLSIPRSRWFGRDELSELETIINAEPREQDLQSFFERNAHFLMSLGYDSVRPHIALRHPGSPQFIPDFFARPMDREFWDIIEIKPAIRDVIVRDRSSVAFSAKVYRGINQLKEYEEYFRDTAAARWLEVEHGMTVVAPQLILLIGNPSKEDLPSLQLLRGREKGVRIITYPELMRICESNILY